jgi:hypothetical protein
VQDAGDIACLGDHPQAIASTTTATATTTTTQTHRHERRDHRSEHAAGHDLHRSDERVSIARGAYMAGRDNDRRAPGLVDRDEFERSRIP